MHKVDVIGLRLSLSFALILALAACATATPLPVTGGQQDNALVKGTAALSFMANTSAADIEAVDGIALKSSESSALVPPGHHSFSVQCTTPALFGAMNFGKATLAFDAEAGHIYQFDSDGPQGDSKDCAPYVYDATGGRGAYSESVNLPLSKEDAANWHRVQGGARGGHTVVDSVPRDQSGKDWQQMVEIESWTKLMFPGTADSFFQQQVANARKTCPDVRVSVSSENANDVIYGFDIPASCAGTDVRSQLGRFQTGQLGIYHATLISRVPLSDADKAKWMKLLETSTVISAK